MLFVNRAEDMELVTALREIIAQSLRCRMFADAVQVKEIKSNWRMLRIVREFQ